MNDPARVKRRYRQFADAECKGYSDLYYGLALAVSEDDEVVGFIAQMPEIQPNLFFASVQFLTGPDTMPKTGADLRAFVHRHRRDISEVMRSRRTQTNEVGRCAVLLPGFPPGPLALIEVGASAGLCLLLDQFYYELGSTPIGDVSSPVHLRCTSAGPVPVPSVVPQIFWRRGLDIDPINVRDDDAVRWLLACVYADHRERRGRLEAAIGLARAQPPVVSAGDLVEDLPAVLAEVPKDVQAVIFHSAVMTYVRPDHRQAFVRVLADASRERDIVWLSNEPLGVIHEVPASVPSQRELRYLLARTLFTNGRRHDELLALAHPHGADLTWL